MTTKAVTFFQVAATGLVLLVQSPDYHLCNDGRPNFAVTRWRNIGQAIRYPHFEHKFMLEKSNYAADILQIGFIADAVLWPHKRSGPYSFDNSFRRPPF